MKILFTHDKTLYHIFSARILRMVPLNQGDIVTKNLSRLPLIFRYISGDDEFQGYTLVVL